MTTVLALRRTKLGRKARAEIRLALACLRPCASPDWAPGAFHWRMLAALDRQLRPQGWRHLQRARAHLWRSLSHRQRLRLFLSRSRQQATQGRPARGYNPKED